MIRLALAFAALLIAANPSAAAEKLVVLLDWYVNPDHAPLVVAKEGGFFARHGLDVELIAPADPSQPPRLVAAKQGDVAVTYQPELHQQVAAGLPLVRFATLIDTPLNTLIALKDGPVKDLKDLKGKKVGYSVTGFEDTLLLAMMETAGLTRDDVELINVNFALTQSLLAKQVDAVVGGYRNFEATQIRLAGGEAKVFFPEENGVPMYDELVFVAHKDTIGDDRLKRFVAALEEATTFLLNHDAETFALYLKGHPDLNDELNTRAWADTRARFAKNPGALDARRYARFAEFLKARGMIKETPAVGTYAVDVR
ncbi:putative hydroxymethylpyrimidine transport system substrate-binding protein [Methylopila capsulata]|uniref:ABC transporter ATP-binding protein n=1 Tax=Methylopila capsulata TaxID=61654 RepID=A0A9W6ISJ4_9HYPH|nr:ABC transporter substrate-binding protein [Methylopila capsulata]MBM7850448.1 putative hydroxymethylpyrimidine transport system substrate-binding protein [Methylopila capsulata]GLK55742.1 ABC transporter ATP-binding protein [Methylopila capsulata]